MIQNGFFINTEGVVFSIINGSIYELEDDDLFKDLKPGYYDNSLKQVSEDDE